MPDQSTCSLCDQPTYCKALCISHYRAARYRARNPLPTIVGMPGERWLPVVGYEGWYEVSDLGRVRRVRQARGAKVGRILRDQHAPSTRGDPRRSITLNKARTMRTHLVHQLVCAAFHPRPDYPCEVNHVDGNTLNNRADNLEWATKSHNARHSYRVLGRKPPTAGIEARRKLTADQVREIRAASGVSQEVLAKRFGVDQTTISKVRLRQSYQHVS